MSLLTLFQTERSSALKSSRYNNSLVSFNSTLSWWLLGVFLSPYLNADEPLPLVLTWPGGEDTIIV